LHISKEVLTVPRLALANRLADWVVFVVEGGRAHQRKVTVGQRDANRVEIVAGVQQGQQVVVNPGTLADGAPIHQRAAP
jgi:multidrug efflux pump subunit AcrA (membrane-fusion protein)